MGWWVDESPVRPERDEAGESELRLSLAATSDTASCLGDGCPRPILAGARSLSELPERGISATDGGRLPPRCVLRELGRESGRIASSELGETV